MSSDPSRCRRGFACFLVALAAFAQCLYPVSAARVRQRSAEEVRHADAHARLSERVAVSAPAEDTPNEDMMLCKRQNMIDLALPYQSDFVVRQGFGWGGTTDNDVYVAATEIFIKDIELQIRLGRTGERSFEFEIVNVGYDGTPATRGGHATAKFEIGGVQVLSRSALVNAGVGIANFVGVADLKKLEKTQTGLLEMNLRGKAEAVWNAESGAWEMKMTEREKRHFKFTIKGQYILEKALNSEKGGVDQKILDGIFGGITTYLLPPELATAFSALPLQEADTQIAIKLTGKMEERGGPLKVGASGEVTFNVQPAMLFKYWTENFNLEKMAIDKVDEFLARDDVQEAWKSDRRAFADNLRRYGFGLLLNKLKKDQAGSSEDVTAGQVEASESKVNLLEAVMDGGNLEDLRPFLYDTAKKAASMLLQIFEPYMNAYSEGKHGLFNGLLAQTDIWANYGHPDARVRAGGNANMQDNAYEKTVLEIPSDLMGIMGLDKVLAVPRGNQTTSQVDFDVEFKGNSFKVKRTQLTDFRLRTGGGVGEDGKEIPLRTFKMNGKASDVSLTIPKSWDKGLDLTCSNAGLEVTPTGLAVELKEGFHFTGAPFDANATEPPQIQRSDHIRRGSPTKIDGPLKTPDGDFTPPFDFIQPQSIDDFAPKWDAGVNIAMSGKDSFLTTTITFDGNVHLGLIDMLKGIMAKRDVQDHGYPFGIARVNRITSGSYSQTNDEEVEVLAMVSCGTIQLISPSILRSDDPWKRMDFSPSKGQLELDITKYHSMPTISDDQRCLELTTNGQPPWEESGRMWTGSYHVHEKICADPSELKKIADPLRLQIERFTTDSRAAAWNYGTHDITKDEQFILGGGRESAPLLKFLREQ